MLRSPFINWNDLTDDEKEQVETSYLSIAEDIADCGDEYDKAEYEMLKNDRRFRLERLQCKSFIRDSNGYIFVNI